MSLFSKLHERATGMRSVRGIREPMRAMIEEGATGNSRPTIDASHEYELLLTLRATYWANTAQIGTARKVAEGALASLLYHDVLDYLQRVEHAISDGNAEDAIHWCGAIRACCAPTVGDK